MARGVKKDPNAFPYWQLTVLGICRFSEPIAFNSILAYSYAMTRDLNGGDDKDASFYSGLLISAYAVAEAITAMGWGALSDRHGRKPVVLFGLGGVALSSLILGFATNYWVALLARFVGGALNGNVSVMQTMVAEMVKLPEHEPAAYATQPFVWVLGSIIGAAVGGFLAKPADFYPGLFSQDGLFGKFPYLLPNLASVAVISLAIIQGLIFLEETNPRVNPAASHAITIPDEDDIDDDETTPLRQERSKTSVSTRLSTDSSRPLFMEESLPVPSGGQGFDIRRGSFGTMRSIDIPAALPQTETGLEDPDEYDGPILNRTIVMLVGALVLFSYHQMAFGALLPIHLLDEPNQPPGHLDLVGGFGYTLHDVSIYLSVNGVISLFIQAFVFPVFVRKVGVWYSFITMITLYPTTYLILPFLSAAPTPAWQSAGIYASLLLQAFYGIILNPSALILLKNATPRSWMLGRVNGLAMSACCMARTVSPPLAGFIYDAGGSGAAWFSCAGVAVLGIVQLLWVPRKHVG